MRGTYRGEWGRGQAQQASKESGLCGKLRQVGGRGVMEGHGGSDREGERECACVRVCVCVCVCVRACVCALLHPMHRVCVCLSNVAVAPGSSLCVYLLWL